MNNYLQIENESFLESHRQWMELYKVMPTEYKLPSHIQRMLDERGAIPTGAPYYDYETMTWKIPVSLLNNTQHESKTFPIHPIGYGHILSKGNNL